MNNRFMQAALVISAAFILLSPKLMSQSNFGIGTTIGGGDIGGNLPSQGSFTSTLFIEGNPGFNFNLTTRLSFIYVADANIIFPQNSARYNPFLKGFSLKGIETQSLSGILFLEEGLGVLCLNDRTFENVNEWDLGLAFSLTAGFDLRSEAGGGFKIGAGTEYGLTFTQTNVNYLSVHLQAEYYFE